MCAFSSKSSQKYSLFNGWYCFYIIFIWIGFLNSNQTHQRFHSKFYYSQKYAKHATINPFTAIFIKQMKLFPFFRISQFWLFQCWWAVTEPKKNLERKQEMPGNRTVGFEEREGKSRGRGGQGQGATTA